MAISKKKYAQMTKDFSPKSHGIRNAIRAFLVGGGICMLGQSFRDIYMYIGADAKSADILVPVTWIVLTAVLTAFGVFDVIAKYAGAGTIVPITGFANSMVSPALEFSSEGRVFGTGAQMFRIAGPVLIYGTSAAALYGIVYSILQ